MNGNDWGLAMSVFEYVQLFLLAVGIGLIFIGQRQRIKRIKRIKQGQSKASKSGENDLPTV